MEFFTKFVQKEINEDQFIEKLKEYTTKIQKKARVSTQEICDISKAVSRIDDEQYNKHVELFIKFGLYISNRGVYEHLYQVGFDGIRIHDNNIDQNDLGLYVIKRVYSAENYRNLLLFMNEILRDEKTIEKKFVLLELYVQILPRIEKREAHLPTAFSVILIAVNEGLQKYLHYKKEKLENTLNEDNKYTQLYMHNFERWTVAFFNRIFDSIKKYPEIANQNVAIKELLTIDAIYDYYDHILALRPENPKLLVKHYILLFVTDLLQGILEAEQSVKDNSLDPETIRNLLNLVEKLLNDIHNDRQELVRNYLIWVKFCSQNAIEIQKVYHQYSKLQPYNPVAMCFFVKNILEDKKASHILTSEYKLRIAIGVLSEQQRLQQAKCQIQNQILDLIAKELQQMTPIKFNSTSYFQVPLDTLTLLFMERAGSGINEEKQYIDAFKVLEQSAEQVWHRVLQKCIQKSSNQNLLSYMINSYRNSQGASTLNDVLKRYEVLIETIFSKELAQIDQKVLLLESAFLLIHHLLKKGLDKGSAELKRWRPRLDQYQNELQSTITFLESREKDQDADKLVADAKYQQLKPHQQQLKVAEYNLSNVYDLLK